MKPSKKPAEIDQGWHMRYQRGIFQNQYATMERPQHRRSQKARCHNRVRRLQPAFYAILKAQNTPHQQTTEGNQEVKKTEILQKPQNSPKGRFGHRNPLGHQLPTENLQRLDIRHELISAAADAERKIHNKQTGERKDGRAANKQHCQNSAGAILIGRLNTTLGDQQSREKAGQEKNACIRKEGMK